jgi:beta-galactosidase GanA
VYNFQDNNDVVAFVQLAQQIGFVVILRVGPCVELASILMRRVSPFSLLRYGCGEHEFGGLPWWLLRDLEGLQVRRMNSGTELPEMNSER